MTKIYAIISAALLVAADQGIKAWVVRELSAGRQITVIPNLFYLTYVENRGAAFGILQGRTAFLTTVVIIVLIIAMYLLLSGKFESNWTIWAVGLILAGGVGNLIDRITLGYVVDYLDFSRLFNFPVFNLADCCVVVGTVIMIGYVLLEDYHSKSAAGGKTL